MRGTWQRAGVAAWAGCAVLSAFAAPPAPDAGAEPAPPPAPPVEWTRERLEREVTSERLGRMARAAGDWILRMQDDDEAHHGRFAYQIDPRSEDRPQGYDTDNFLRQAGTSYALLLLHEATGEARYLAGGERGVAWALTRLARDPALPDQAFFEDQGQVKLGGAALPLLCLMKLEQLRRTSPHEEVMAQLTRFLVGMQAPDGEFQSVYRYAGSREHPKVGWDSLIYPGEAMLALARRFARTRDPALRATIDRALTFYRARQDRSFQQAFVPWTTSAMVELYEATGDERYAAWAIELTDFLVRTQFTDGRLPSFGAFRPKPGANTGTYLEGILDATRLVVRRGDAARVGRYRFSALAGYHFLAGLQFDRAAAAAYPAPAADLLGGFRTAPDDPRLRIDNTQHALSALVKAPALWAPAPAAPAAR